MSGLKHGVDRNFDVAVLGGLNVDYLIHGGPLPRPGETTEGTDIAIGSGGKGGNQAVAVARLGGRVSMIGLVGNDDAGERLVDDLRSEGVGVMAVMATDAHRSGSALIMVGTGGEKQIMVAPGANRAVEVDHVRRAASRIADASVLLTQLEIPIDATIEACRIAGDSGTRVILDAAPASSLPRELLMLVDVIRCNAHEAEAATSVTVTDESSARRAADTLLGAGVKVAIVQAGESGDLVATGGQAFLLPRIPVHSVDNTGAGDAFISALALELARNESLNDAASFANAAAALATTSVGARAGLPYRTSVLDLLATR